MQFQAAKYAHGKSKSKFIPLKFLKILAKRLMVFAILLVIGRENDQVLENIVFLFKSKKCFSLLSDLKGTQKNGTCLFVFSFFQFLCCSGLVEGALKK